MTTSEVFEIITIALCVAIIPIWLAIGRLNRRVGWWALIPIVLALLPLAFNLVAFFSDLPAQNPVLFNLLSQALRILTLSVILVGGSVMLIAQLRRRESQQYE